MKQSTKAIITGGIIITTLGTTIPIQCHSLETTKTQADIVVRVGEYPNKPGKRLTGIDKDFDIDIPLKYDEETGWHIQEYDFNYKVANAIVKYLESQGVNVILQDTENKSQDLNSAGRRAKQYNPKIYLSVHHNSYASDSSGYFFMSNVGDTQSSQYAKRLSNAMSDSPMLIPQMENRSNVNNYIGELNQEPGIVNILGEFGFALSNPNEAKKCASDEQVDYIAKQIGDELIKILQEINN